MFNQITLCGRVTDAPDIRDLGNGHRVALFHVETCERSGSTRYPERHRVEAYGDGLITLIANLARPDAIVLVTGKNRSRPYPEDARFTQSYLAMNNGDRFTVIVGGNLAG